MAIGCCAARNQAESPGRGAAFTAPMQMAQQSSTGSSNGDGSSHTGPANGGTENTAPNAAGEPMEKQASTPMDKSISTLSSRMTALPSLLGGRVQGTKSNTSGGSGGMKKMGTGLSSGSARSSSGEFEDAEGTMGEFPIFHRATSIDMQFPMYVISVKDVLQLGEVLPHQELKRMGKLVEYKKGMIVIFVSHQWTARAHPDQHMHQFKVLQEMFANLTTGKAQIGVCPMTTMITGRTATFTDPNELKDAEEMYIWYDYFSIMQPSVEETEEGVELACSHLFNAVNSIPAYVELSSHFLALTPGLAHADTGEALFYTSWLGRGWCRAEHTAWSLTGRPMLVVVGPIFVVEAVLNVQWVFHSPFRGDFGVESDRIKVDAMMRTMLDSRVDRVRKEGNHVFFWRFLKALGQHYVQRERFETNLEKWLEGYQFNSPLKATQEKSWLPIHYAAMEGNLEILKALVARGASVNSSTGRAHDSFFVFKKMTPAAIAALFSPSSHGVPMLKLLVDLNANLHAKDGKGQTLLQLAVLGEDNSETIEFLLDHGLDTEAKTQEGNTALHLSCLVGRTKHCQLLIDRGASVVATNEFEQGMLVSASPFGSCGTVDALLMAGAEPDQQVPATAKMRILSSLATLGLRVKPQVVLGHMIKNIPGLTPLQIAAYLGDLGSVKSLLTAGADPMKTNFYGLNSFDFCRLGSDTIHVHEILTKAAEGIVTI